MQPWCRRLIPVGHVVDIDDEDWRLYFEQPWREAVAEQRERVQPPYRVVLLRRFDGREIGLGGRVLLVGCQSKPVGGRGVVFRDVDASGLATSDIVSADPIAISAALGMNAMERSGSTATPGPPGSSTVPSTEYPAAIPATSCRGPDFPPILWMVGSGPERIFSYIGRRDPDPPYPAEGRRTVTPSAPAPGSARRRGRRRRA